jgi:hypothetical protein
VKILETNEGKVVRVSFVDLCFERNTKTIYCAMYSKRKNIYFKTRYDG